MLSGRYRLDDRIGAGGAGSVWRATDTVLGRTVAVKLLHPAGNGDEATLERFRREATSAAALSHRSTVTIYDIGRDDDQVFLVMEFVDGPSLDELLRRGPLDPATTAALGHQVAAALGAAHQRGMVHRDVKPANVMINREGVAKVADFGIAKVLGDDQATLTSTGTILGTAAYLAPEQLRGDEVDARADVYALGLVLFECLTGQPPFGRGTAVEVAARRLTADVPPPSTLRGEVPPALDEVIVRATRPDPEDRYQDGTALATALASILPSDPERRLAALGTTTLQPTEALQVTAAVADGGATTRVVDRPVATAAMPSMVPAEAPPAAPDEPAPARPVPPQPRTPLLMGALALLVLAVVVVALLGGGGDGPGGTGDGDDGGAPTDRVEVADGSDFDPHGDGSEHPERVRDAFDGDPETAWRTEGYNSAALGGLKPGVGIFFDLSESREVTRLRLSLRPAGASVEVYAADQPFSGTDPAQWGQQVATVGQAGADQEIPLDETTAARYWLLWFTSLPADGGRHRVHVADVAFHAAQ